MKLIFIFIITLVVYVDAFTINLKDVDEGDFSSSIIGIFKAYCCNQTTEMAQLSNIKLDASYRGGDTTHKVFTTFKKIIKEENMTKGELSENDMNDIAGHYLWNYPAEE